MKHRLDSQSMLNLTRGQPIYGAVLEDVVRKGMGTMRERDAGDVKIERAARVAVFKWLNPQ